MIDLLTHKGKGAEHAAYATYDIRIHEMVFACKGSLAVSNHRLEITDSSFK